MESMTGYSSFECRTNQFSYSIEIKSLNSKYLEIFTYLPKILRKEEIEFTQYLKNKFSRGKIVLTIEIFDWIEERTVYINRKLLSNIHDELKKIEKEFKRDNFFSGDFLFSFDNVIQKSKVSLSDESYSNIRNSLDKVIDKTIKVRIKEGSVIKKDLQNSLNSISKNLNLIKKQAKDISNVLFKKYKNSIESLVNASIDEVRLYTEVAILTDKLDLNEEIVRLASHIDKFKSLMNENDQIGKRLDFLAQEMFREINTISSKANNSTISHHVVDMKNHIDKIREHSRNIK